MLLHIFVKTVVKPFFHDFLDKLKVYLKLKYLYFTKLDLLQRNLRSLSSAHEKWGQKQKCCVYNFGQCIY